MCSRRAALNVCRAVSADDVHHLFVFLCVGLCLVWRLPRGYRGGGIAAAAHDRPRACSLLRSPVPRVARLPGAACQENSHVCWESLGLDNIVCFVLLVAPWWSGTAGAAAVVVVGLALCVLPRSVTGSYGTCACYKDNANGCVFLLRLSLARICSCRAAVPSVPSALLPARHH